MLTQHEIVEIACAHLQHWWELHGPTGDPAEVIRQIVSGITPHSHGNVRQSIEASMYDRWAQLLADNPSDD